MAHGATPARFLNCVSLIPLGAMLLAAPAHAQDSRPVAGTSTTAPSTTAGQDTRPAQIALEAPDTGAIVVTATRGVTNLQSTPLSVEAIGGNQLQERKILTLSDLSSSVPGFEFGQAYGQAQPAIRGIGSNETTPGNDPRVAFYQDDVYIARPEAQMGGLFDVDQVEVLRGPQGALYGRNATAGAIILRTRQPSFNFGGYIDVTGGNYGLIQTEGAVGGPVSDKLAIRASWQTVNHTGYGHNVVTGNGIDNASTQSGRIALLYKPSTVFDITLRADYHHENDRNYGLHYGGAGSANATPAGVRLGGIVTAPYSRDIADEIDPLNQRNFWGTEADAKLHLDGVTLRSITSYRSIKTLGITQLDASSLPLLDISTVNNSKQFSQELQAYSETHGTFTWIVGANYFHEKLLGQQDLPLNTRLIGGANTLMAGLRTHGEIDTDSLAAYGRGTINFSDKLSFSLGGRLSYEKKHVMDVFSTDLRDPVTSNPPLVPDPGFPRDTSQGYTAFTPQASLNYQFDRNVFGYVSFSRGFKSGGYTLGTTTPAFRPETVDSYEAGLRTSTADHRLTANVSAFYATYKDLQVKVTRGTVNVTENAAAARIYGGEADVIARPVSGVQLEASVAYNHARYTSYLSTEPAFAQLGIRDLSGNHLIQAPDFTASISGQYRWSAFGGHMTLRGEYYHSSTIYFTPFQREHQDPYHLINGFLTFEGSGGWELSAFVRNLQNKTVLAYSSPLSSLVGFTRSAFLKPPRTYGVTLGYHF
jgi:iron complex outermembrane receptor protein